MIPDIYSIPNSAPESNHCNATCMYNCQGRTQEGGGGGGGFGEVLEPVYEYN